MKRIQNANLVSNKLALNDTRILVTTLFTLFECYVSKKNESG